MQIQEFQIPHHGRCVDAVFYRPEAAHRFPVILFSHGYNGCKTDFDTSAAYFAENGIGASALPSAAEASGTEADLPQRK